MTFGFSVGWLLLAGLASFILGVILLGCALWVRRRGDAPHCRCCGYNLTNLTSDRCPECGTPLSDKTVARGARERRPFLAIVGLSICLLAAVPWYRGARQVD